MISPHILVSSRFLRTCSQRPTPVARGTTRGHLPQKDGQRPASLKTQAHGNQDSTNVATRRRSLWSSENLPIECQTAEVKKNKSKSNSSETVPQLSTWIWGHFLGRFPMNYPPSTRVVWSSLWDAQGLETPRLWRNQTVQMFDVGTNRKTQPFEDDCISKKKWLVIFPPGHVSFLEGILLLRLRHSLKGSHPKRELVYQNFQQPIFGHYLN